ncbi:MAG: nickel pincer cofactor biosynthesis protein LarC [Actinomycetes bacterium]
MNSSRGAWFQLSSGVAGDMLLGSLIDAGASLDVITGTVKSLGLEGWSLTTEQVSRSGLAATRAVVEVHDPHAHRTWRDIAALLVAAPLPPRVFERSHSAFSFLASVEADLHGVSVDDVHFHEVGGHDAIIDIVGTMAALENLDVEVVSCSPIAVGHGAITTDHGILPNPAPATVRLLEGFTLVGVETPTELATPTGAAILASLCSQSQPLPRMSLSAHGLGAGTRDLPGRANVVSVLVGTLAEGTTELVAVIETNLDDVTGEHLGIAITDLMEAGALDAWVTPITMKKGRPGHTIAAMSNALDAKHLARVMMQVTGSPGVRTSLVERAVLDRAETVVSVLGHPIRVKRSAVRNKPESDDIVAVARATNRTLGDIESLVAEALGETHAAASSGFVSALDEADRQETSLSSRRFHQ